MRSMCFIDYQNFEINKSAFLKDKKLNVNYSLLSKEINGRIHLEPIPTLLKTFLFAYKPCEQLLQLDRYSKYYFWLSSLKSKPFIEVIEGTQEIRQISKDTAIDINDSSTYHTEEKGTDINVAVNMLTKAYQNAFDVAILISGDTDYIPVIEALHNIGKLVIVSTLPNQNVNKYKNLYDEHIPITEEILDKCKTQSAAQNETK